MRFLLFNPPGAICYTRDYFCSKATKAGYIEHPIDLLILSGIISSGRHKVDILDAAMLKLDANTALQRINSLNVDAIIFLSGSVSQKEDFDFMQKVKYNLPDLILIGIGDIFLDKKVFLRNNWIDMVLLDFTAKDILKYFEGERNNLRNISFREKDKIVIKPRQENFGKFNIPLPRHELFLDKRYRFPFARSLPFATILTDYGCPFNCSFCLYSSLGFKTRNLDNVFEELTYLRFLGIKELFIKDQCFGADKVRSITFCEGVYKIGKFSWTSFLRTDNANLDLLTVMKKAGCHTIMFGVESASEEILQIYKPGVNRGNIEKAFKLSHSVGINAVGLFILGFPGESKKSCLDTINFALRLKCDYASFNLFVPKIQTPARKDLIKDNLLKEDRLEAFDQSGIASVWHNNYLTQQELVNLRHFALRRFYLRPFYMIKRLFSVFCSVTRLKLFFDSACFILKDLTRKYVLL